MDVSIIIINYNTRQMTAECIDSVFEKTNGVEFEIILVDNASTDDSKEFFEKDQRITYIYNKENLGFGRANNIGAKYATGKYLFLLNSDTLIATDNAIGEFFNYMEDHPNIASCGGNLIAKDGQNNGSYGNFPSLLQVFSEIGFYRLYKKYYQQRLSLSQKVYRSHIHSVNYICGADIFIKKTIFDDFNGFDEDFFMYYEETDLYWRLNKAGYKSVIIPNIKIIHLEGQSTKKGLSHKINMDKFNMLHKSQILFFKKNKPSVQFILVKLFNIISIIIRFYKGKVMSRISAIVNA